jgi:hypothetical protein
MIISVKTFMHQKQTLAKISGSEIMFAETHTPPPPPPPPPPHLSSENVGWGGNWGGPYGGHMSQNLHWNHYIIGLSIANELDRERLRNFCDETETEIVRNSKVLVDFEVRT